jgi:hypothetical protein
MSEQMTPPGAAAAHFAPSFTDLQAVIEALDRAMADEQQLPEGYAPEEWEPIPAASSGDSKWHAELLDERAPLPAPFKKSEHAFDSFAGAVAWLGEPEVIHTVDGELARRTILSRRA